MLFLLVLSFNTHSPSLSFMKNISFAIIVFWLITLVVFNGNIKSSDPPSPNYQIIYSKKKKIILISPFSLTNSYLLVFTTSGLSHGINILYYNLVIKSFFLLFWQKSLSFSLSYHHPSFEYFLSSLIIRSKN